MKVDRADTPLHYHVFNLAVASALPLDPLPAKTAADPVDVAIRFGPVPASPSDPRSGYGLTGAGVLLVVPAVGRFLISGGREILVEPAPGVSTRNLRLYVLGSALGAILHQRGLLPLHANAVAIGGGAAAFLGPSGAGKSTLAAWFGDAGHAVICDDVCVVAGAEAGRPHVLPGLPRLRLKADAMRHSGRDAADFDLSFDGDDKYDVPIAAPHGAGHTPLRALYVITPEPAERFEIAPLSGVAALGVLVANTYRGGLIGMLGQQRRHLEQCAALARSTPVFEVRRTWRRDAMDGENRRLAEHAAADLGTARSARS